MELDAKDLRIQELETRVADLEQRNESLEAEKAAHKQQIDDLLIDPLTGLAVRRRVDEELQGIFTGQREEDSEDYQALIVFDLDGFKGINDTKGHGVGDAVLGEVGKVVRENIRRADLAGKSSNFAGRPGGDEFVILLRVKNPDAVGTKVEILRRAIQEIRIAEAPDLPISASFGAVILNMSASLKENLELADRALYDSKKRGRNRVTVVGRD